MMLTHLVIAFALITANGGITALPSINVGTIVSVASDLATDLSSSPESVELPWSCDVRAWVRAPDLSPGNTYPAEARLAVNGTDCGNIDGWQVGLRFKERSIVKLRSKNVDVFPTKPGWNHSAYQFQENFDWDDIYSTGHFGRSDPFREREDRMAQYNLAIQNRSLWEVHGAERIVFDVIQDLPLPSFKEKYVDLMESFAVHVPNTNFPPIQASPFEGGSMGVNEQMVRTETQLEYYHSIHLANGSTLDVPAGRAAFLPAQQPVAHRPIGIEDSLLAKASRLVELKSPRLMKQNDDDNEFGMFGDKRPLAPECDDGNLAQFSIEVQPLQQPAVQGHNITINITLTRSGNGTEHPVSLDVGHITNTNLTWVWGYVRDAEEYENLVNPPNRGFVIYPDSQATEMLMIKSDAALEKERERIMGEREGTMMHMDRWRFDLPRKGYVRHNFVKGEEKDVYHLQIELPIAYNDFPTFETTFQTFRSTLDFKIRTTFSCLAPPPTAESDLEEGLARAASLAEDEAWTPFSLPLAPEKKRDRTEVPSYRAEPHVGTLPLDILASQAVHADGGRPVHYLDSASLGPVLTRQLTDTVQYPLLSQHIREEKEDELRKSRYGAMERNQRQYMIRGNSGGGWMHAAKLWQRKERKGEITNSESSQQNEDQNGVEFIVQ